MPFIDGDFSVIMSSMAFFEKIVRFFQDMIENLSNEGKRRLVLVLTGAFAVILTISVVASLNISGGEKRPDQPEKKSAPIPIPAEEIFLPDEPDFIPGVLLEREQRASWSEDDAAVFWRDPLVYGEEPWREKIETAVDEFLERVP